MTDKIVDTRIRYIYKITNIINGKIYIGQTVQPNKRWNAHKNKSAYPKQCISFAIQKYGNQSFEFEVIAGCKSLEDANDIELILIEQYNSLVPNGYNVALGGMNAPKTEEWKKIISQKAQERAPETSKQMAAIAANRSEDYYDHFKGNQHATGFKHTDEWKEMMSNRVQSEEEKLKRSESLKKSYANGERISYFRDKEPWNKNTKSIMKANSASFKPGQIAHNKKHWTAEQLSAIISDSRTLKEIAVEYNVSLNTIWELKKANNANQSVKDSSKKRRILSDEQVLAIRQEYANDSSRGSQSRLAKKYNVKQQMINKILNNKSYM